VSARLVVYTVHGAVSWPSAAGGASRGPRLSVADRDETPRALGSLSKPSALLRLSSRVLPSSAGDTNFLAGGRKRKEENSQIQLVNDSHPSTTTSGRPRGTTQEDLESIMGCHVLIITLMPKLVVYKHKHHIKIVLILSLYLIKGIL